ncbi:MAG: hypothetical protein K2W81_02385 [Sphingomonas sp.]|uniref:hypothetical protein n=1 Tax=Sphingomonas sp. TaxID=28214 RepID=UPI0025EA9D9F|nr:hypothetical protein [Sphingomonas sp.]MBY0282796.1 hypothetical protein [Sphingomonas sp.]
MARRTTAIGCIADGLLLQRQTAAYAEKLRLESDAKMIIIKYDLKRDQNLIEWLRRPPSCRLSLELRTNL